MKTAIHMIIFVILGVLGANYAHAIEKCVDPVTKKVTFTDTGCAKEKAVPVERTNTGTFSTTDSSGVKPQKATSLEAQYNVNTAGPSIAGGTNAKDAANAAKKRSADINHDSARLKSRYKN